MSIKSIILISNNTLPEETCQVKVMKVAMAQTVGLSGWVKMVI